MEPIIYPYHALDPYPAEDNVTSRTGEIAASLLYFPSVTLGRIGFPDELQLYSSDEILEERRRIIARRGEAMVQAYFRQYIPGDLTLGEKIKLDFTRYWYREQKFRQSYLPLIQAGVLKTVSLAQITEEMKQTAQIPASDSDALSLKAPLNFFLTRYYDKGFAPWFKDDPAAESAFSDASNDSDGHGLMGMYLWKTLAATDSSGFFEKTDPVSQLAFMDAAFMLDVFHQTLLSTILRQPILVYENAHIQIREKFLSTISEGKGNTPSTPDQDRVALSLFTETLRHPLHRLPIALPRSPEAILELRNQLSEELDDFRQALQYAARDFLYEASTGPVSEEKIKQIADKNFMRPVEKLERRLRHPGREMLRNLFTAPPWATAAISFSVSALAGSLAASTILGALGATAALIAKTKVDRAKAVEDSDVAFLFRMAQKNR